MINNDTEFVSALKLKIVEDNLSTMTFNDLLKLKEALDRRIDAKIIAGLVISTIKALKQSKDKGE